MSDYKFTVFTATYNRSHLLGRVYESLKKQTFKDFEWIIVDDGSSDKTNELVQSWIKEGNLAISFFQQKNSGKHVAINLGVSRAQGELFLILDSDDECFSNSLEKLNFYWEKIPYEKKNSFSGVYGNCIDRNNQIIGSKFPSDLIDVSFLDIYYKFNIKGDKWGFFRTDILKEYSFPVIEGEKFLTEAVAWNRIALKYKTRFVNENFLLVEYQSNGLSGQSLKVRVKNPLGAALYYGEFLSMPIPVYWKIRGLLNYLRFSFHGNLNIFKQISKINHYFFGLFLLPLGYIIYRNDLKKLRKQD
jgi:glycosyltransferase involved in cell wall biosynthesis